LDDICQKAVKGNKTLGRREKTPNAVIPTIRALLQQLTAQAPKINLLNKPSFMTSK